MNTHSSHVHTTFSQLEHILDVQKKSQMDLEGIILSEVNQTEEDQKKKKTRQSDLSWCFNCSTFIKHAENV